ncbi:uncharacterized protein EV420DRAFT_849268 [Desarmillaria tabescens]|uniref:Uncharacterized protein n=1 Tax=Armillaria tabescens TaxID=1929756 RepID=A0AA39MVK3_ARMTA|nr:uncharacterized protein EV420DRAFT_849268 [Desarmillaria tabescens]KAK0448262.1 hypothetical protein EV420DRAFT_849268 [Desarmillaria tabescens]
MSSLPLRARCIQVHDGTACWCPWFISPASPLLDQTSCAACGHGIHGHVDYVSMFVHCCAATQCAAYAQKTPQTQACTCSAQLADHGLAVNLHRPADPSDIAGLFVDDILVNGLPSNDDASYSSGYTTNSTVILTPFDTPTPSTVYSSARQDAIQPKPYGFDALSQMEDILIQVQDQA